MLMWENVFGTSTETKLPVTGSMARYFETGSIEMCAKLENELKEPL
jgi:hypothetical protein